MYHWSCYLWLPHYFGKPQYIIYIYICFYVHMFELTKKTWRITNIFSVRIREDNWYTCQAVDICFHDFCWIFFGSWKFVSQTYTFCRLCPFITFKGLKWLKCCDVWEGHEPRKTTRLFDPKSGKLSVISFIFKGLYSILEYICIVYTSEIWRSPALFCVCEIWKLGNLPKREYFSYQLDQE